MIPTIKRILYATDLSDNARYAFGYAADLASRYDARITILSVIENLNRVAEIEIMEMMGPEKWETFKSGRLENLKGKIRERIRDVCAEMDQEIDTCSLMADDIRVTRGVPYEEILKAAEDAGADIIVMGTRGYTMFKDSLLGGTARRIVKDSRIPVMVIRLPESG